jgi:hypothetical protein
MKTHQFLTTGEAADLLSQQLGQTVKYYDLDNLLRAKSIPAPQKIGGRRVWSADDLRKAAKAIRIRRAKRPVFAESKSIIE